MELKYTPKESLELIIEVYPNDWKEILANYYYQIIIGVSKTNKWTLEQALNHCMNLQSELVEKVRYMAAYQFLVTDNLLTERINDLDHEISKLCGRSAHLEMATDINSEERGYARTAVYNRINSIQLEKQHLHYAKTCVSNISVEAEIIRPNGSKPERSDQ